MFFVRECKYNRGQQGGFFPKDPADRLTLCPAVPGIPGSACQSDGAARSSRFNS